jgi:hypothetical protein
MKVTSVKKVKELYVNKALSTTYRSIKSKDIFHCELGGDLTLGGNIVP